MCASTTRYIASQFMFGMHFGIQRNISPTDVQRISSYSRERTCSSNSSVSMS